ncbi:MAG: tail fiber domain-containing protein [Bacteriovorax sp.]|nr:tail fiber domain-containing protein [Bacteriovorax sp.]
MPFIIAIFFLLSGCIAANIEITLNPHKKMLVATSVSSVQAVNHQLIINGSDLGRVKSVQLKNNITNEALTVETSTSTTNKIIANGIRNITIGVGEIFDLILSDAYGAATYQVTFSLENGSVTAAHLSSMNATKGQILKYNGSAWAPSAMNAQTYIGAFDASVALAALPDPLLYSSGDYFIIGQMGTIAGISYQVGDWIILNSLGTTWDKVSNSSNVVSSFKGRRGLVVPQAGDYVWSDITKTSSKLEDIADIDITGRSNGQVLKWNSTSSKWVVADDLNGGGNAATVTTNANLTGDVTSVGNATTIGAAKVQLTMLSASGTPDATNYLKGNNTWSTFITDVIASTLGTITGSNTAIVIGDSIQTAFDKTQGQITALKGDYVSKSGTNTVTGSFDLTGIAAFLSIPTSTGVTLSEAANVGYVQGLLGKSGAVTTARTGSFISNTATSSTASIAKIGLDIQSTGVWNGATATNTGLNVNVSGGTTNYAALFNGGNVGIGTTSPSYPLHIESASGNNVFIHDTLNGTGNTSDLMFGIRGVGNNEVDAQVSAIRTDAVTNADTDLAFSTFHSGLTERMRITSSGNVGIGTTDPIAVLDVEGPSQTLSSTSGLLEIYSNDAWGQDKGGSIMLAGPDGSNPGRAFGAIGGFKENSTSADYAGYLAFATRPMGAAPAEQVRITSTGKVGVGTKTPQMALDIVGDTTATAFGSVGASTSGISLLDSLANPVTRNWRMVNGHNGPGLLEFEVSSAAGGNPLNSVMAITSTGNVGIGIPNPGERLEVFNGSTTGTYTTTGWTHVSDRRLKHDIEPLENSLDKILQLRGVEYKFNNDPQNKTQIGFIAQEVEPIFPEVVLTDKKGLKSMVYSNLVAPLVEAIKEINKRTTELFRTTEGHSREIASVKAENVQLKARADKAEKENATIKARLDKMESALNGPK